MFEQIHDGMREAYVIALLGEPWPAKYDGGRQPVPVALILGPWGIVRVIPSQALGVHDSGIAKQLEFVGDEWGISVSFNVAGQMARGGDCCGECVADERLLRGLEHV